MANLKPKVSVVMSVYNGEPYFERGIPSILKQTFQDFEFIIIDDGSSDRTPELLQDLAQKDHRVKIFSPGRLGFVKALNYGITQAQGEYIARQDIDDTSTPERLALQVEFLEAHPEVGVVGGYYILIDENRQEKYIRMSPLEHTKITQAMAKYIPICHTIATFRKKAWQEAGGYPLLDDIEDLRLWLTFAKMGWHLANIPQILGEHWVYANSFWHKQFQYQERQKKLAHVQELVIKELHLPFWFNIYPYSRYLYAYFPNSFKRFLRRNLTTLKEKDLSKNSEA